MFDPFKLSASCFCHFVNGVLHGNDNLCTSFHLLGELFGKLLCGCRDEYAIKLLPLSSKTLFGFDYCSIFEAVFFKISSSKLYKLLDPLHTDNRATLTHYKGEQSRRPP